MKPGEERSHIAKRRHIWEAVPAYAKSYMTEWQCKVCGVIITHMSAHPPTRNELVRMRVERDCRLELVKQVMIT